MMEFDEKAQFRYYNADKTSLNYWCSPQIDFLFNGHQINMQFNTFQKRIELNFLNFNTGIFGFLEKKGLMMTTKNRNHNSQFSLKYSERNCERIANIISAVYCEFLSEKKLGEFV